MKFYDVLMIQSKDHRQDFQSIPIIKDTIANGISLELYIAFLEQAYQHVKHTCNLLALAASRCGPDDRRYQNALFDYINEEKGHELWILNDIKALGGDSRRVASTKPGTPCAAMIGYAYYSIEHISPYCLLGMVHVLEGMSVALAQSAAETISGSLERTFDDGGFSYLTSHGALDHDHVAFFIELVNGITNPDHQNQIIASARIIYELYGNVFRSLDKHLSKELTNAA